MELFHNQSRNGSAPDLSPIPQGIGREGKRKGMESGQEAIHAQVGGATAASMDGGFAAGSRWSR